MTTTKRGQGVVVSRTPGSTSSAGNSGPAVASLIGGIGNAPAGSAGRRPIGGSLVTPGAVVFRADTPFQGEGQQVSLTAEPGFTLPGKLPVPLRLQLPPHEAIERTAAYTWSNFDTLDPDDAATERTRPGGRRLRTIQVSTMFLDWDPWFEVWQPSVLDPVLAAREVEHVCLDGLRFRLRIHNPSLYDSDDVNMLATMPQCTVREEPGEPDTRYVALQFQEYVPTDVERKAIKNEVGPWTHTIKSEDTLYKLSKHYYKRQSDWQRIAAANKGLAHWVGSRSLLEWSHQHKVKSLKIPARLDAKIPVAA